MTKKRGLFSRLFGSDTETAESSPEAFVGEEAADLKESPEQADQDSQAAEDGPAEEGLAEDVSDADASDADAEEEVVEAAVEEASSEDQTSQPALSDDMPSEDQPHESEVAAPDVDEEEGDTALETEPSSEISQEEEVTPEPEKKLSWFERLKRGLSRSSGALGEGISSIFNKRKLDDDTLQDLEDILIQADLGVETAMTITERLAEGRYNKEVSDREVQEILADEVNQVLEPVAQPLVAQKCADGSPHVILMIGVNGAGKTTTIGKLAQKFQAEGKSVMLAAGDTFRAAAIDQLKVWGERTGSAVMARDVGSDAAGLAFDAMQEAKEQGRDILMIDTAGRLQNRTELMAELEKIVRVIKKHDETAPHSVLLVLDATTGQNALNQVDVFSKMAGVTGLVMTKLDGTARGGILVAISAKYKLPVHFVGVGEGVDDLEPFQSKDFAQAIAGLAE
ncbi:MAG: signal recognition particle-docking protein FtsY [Cohaesibacter sp.]|jgi:fused signal recognition particle receptor|nr:signal recognition particle-docking protein FtsY [Cohaesibacter sp.]